MDVDAQRVLEHLVRGPEPPQQEVGRHHAAGAAQQDVEELGLGGGQRHLAAVDHRPLMREVDRQAAVHPHHRLQGVGEVADAAEHPLDPGHHLPRLERLADVVLGEALDRLHHRLLLVDRGEHDDGQVAPLLELAGERHAVDPRQQDVHQRQVRQPPPGDGVERLLGRGAGPDREAGALQLPADQAQEVRVVLDGENPAVGGPFRERRGRAASCVYSVRPLDL